MEKSGFFNSSNGDRKYKADFFAEYFASFIGNGVFPNPSTGLQVTSNGDMTITIKPGKAWINGYYYLNDSDLILNIDVADGVLKRIDRIVLQYNAVDRIIVAKIKKGTFGSTPVAPTLKRDADAYELGIADIYVGNGAVSISQANITDLRLDSTKCGIVHGTVEQTDTTTIFNQYLDWYKTTIGQAETNIASLQTQLESDFNTWFATIQAALDGDTAGNLLNQINNLAGAGRTTETVKGNADAIAALSQSVESQLAQKMSQESFNVFKNEVVKFKISTTLNDADGEPDGTILFYTGA